MPMTSVISEVATPKGQTKSNRLARLSHDLKICAKFPVFLTVINRRGVYTPKGLPASKHRSKINRDNKSAS